MVKILPNLKTSTSPASRGIFLTNFSLPHVLKTEQFGRSDFERIFDQTSYFKKFNKAGQTLELLKGYIVAMLFFEPSTRTRFSFETAAKNLGAKIITAESAGMFSSTAKGESIEDTIRVVESYSDTIVIRHPEIGSAQRAAKVASIPIVNAGDGAGSHPTQSLTDLYTIKSKLGRVDDLKIAVVGDLLHGRAARSFCLALANFEKIKLYLISPRQLKLGSDIKDFLKKRQIKFAELKSWEDIINELDVIYMTRIQRERFASEREYKKIKGTYQLRKKDVLKMKRNSLILHPLPRVDEIDLQVDRHPQAAYFQQAKNGVPVRMALLAQVLKT